MAKFLNFFPRQMMMGEAAASGTVYSDIFDVTDVSNVTTEMQTYVSSGAATVVTSVQLEQNQDPAFSSGSWSSYGSAMAITGINTGTANIATVPRRFLRAKLEVAPTCYVVVRIQARGFC